MPNSLKVMIKKLAHKGCISSAECDELLTKLNGHDSEIRADERAKTIDEYDDFIAKNKGTIDYTTNRPCVKIDGVRIFAKESFMEQMKGVRNDD